MCEKKIDLSGMAKRWPSTIVAREQIGQFTGGTISPAYMANLDNRGAGPEGRIKIGRKVAYPIDTLVSWLENRSCVQDEGSEA